MEFDNDRLIKRPHKIETFYWIIAFFIYPLVNFFTVFPGHAIVLPMLLALSIVTFPLYVLYSRTIVPAFLFTQRYVYFTVITLAFFIIIHLVLILLFYVFTSIEIPAHLRSLQSHFVYSPVVIIRESLWFLVNTLFAIHIAFLKTTLDEKDTITTLEKENTAFKLRYLRSQLNPHFLFNTLNSIYSLSLQKSDSAPGVVVKLADLMRYMIYDCNEEKVPLSREIEFIENYIAIEKMRHKADVRFTVEGETTQVMVEPLLFISFIENGFKHAFANTYSGAYVYITLKAAPGHLALTVVNNTHIDVETQAKRIHGKGIRNSKTILEMLYPESHELDIIQTDTVELRKSDLRLKHARERLQHLYPDSHTLDVILSNNSFTVSLIIKRAA